MKLLLILTLLQSNWIPIKEMSGNIPNYPGITIETYASEIARDGDVIKLKVRFDFPWGVPMDWVREAGFNSSISRVELGVKLDCKTLIVTPMKGSADVYQFNGKKLKSKEPPIPIKEGHVFEKYFCERGGPATVAPTLKP